MIKHVKFIENIFIKILIIMMIMVIIFSIIELGWLLIKVLISPPIMLFGIDELLNVFGMFLIVLLGIELLETLMVFITDKELRAEVIILVAIIALSRKIVILDIKETAGTSMLGIAAIDIALAIVYYTIKKVRLLRRTSDSA